MGDITGIAWGRRGKIERGLTEHERVGEEGREGNEEAAKATSYVRKLGCLARAGEGGVVGFPVEFFWGRGVAEGMVRERVGMRALAVVSFLWAGGRTSGLSAGRILRRVGRHTWGRRSF